MMHNLPGGSTSTAASAPGKVLLAGGYLVLDRAYTGLTFGLDARIHAVVREWEAPGNGRDGEGEGAERSLVEVRSPQFEDAVWRYGIGMLGEGGGVEVAERGDCASSHRPNTFIETTLTYALTYVAAVHPSPTSTHRPTRITILADNDYYSTPTPPHQHTTPNPTRFKPHHTTLSAAHKTGLGSSAALVTSLTAALLTHHLPGFTCASPPCRRTLHNLAQAAHSAAQGKVGSGFDVASAVYGSCRYRRFSPSLLAALDEPGTGGFAGRLRGLVERGNGDGDGDGEGGWDGEVRPLGERVLGRAGLRLAMLDVDAGTGTPGMVGRVLGWRARNAGVAKGLWDEIGAANEALADALGDGGAEWGKGERAGRVKEAIGRIREGMRRMSREADVPVEPEGQTRLIDAVSGEVEGVLGGVVPGAGGFDAVALVVEDREGVESGLRDWVGRWRGGNRQDGGRGADKDGAVKLLGVREDNEGVKEEDTGGEMYKEWL